jgi:uncharacterized protein (TIGR00661 family)
MKVLFAVNSNGLGHATRCTPLIRAIINDKHEVCILSSNRALEFLKNEFGDKVKEYFMLPDYSLQNRIFTEKNVSINKFVLFLPLYIKEVYNEHKDFLEIHKKYQFDTIISDTRYGIYDKNTPSYLICHHIKMKGDGIWRFGDRLTEFALYIMRKKYKKILIPDFEENSVSGEYTHNFRFLKKKDIEYLGILSMVEKLKVKEDVDYFFSISGPEPQRTVFENIVLPSLDKIKGKKIVVALGQPENKSIVKKSNATIYGFFDRKEQEKMMNRSKLVITRSGYTTVMELAELGKKALFVPTKGQPEQEYLAVYHKEKGNYHYCSQDEMKIPEDLDIAMSFPGVKAQYKTIESVKKFMGIVFNKN